MLNKVYFCNGHLTSLAFFILENEGLNFEEKQLILSHLSNCSFCMDRYVDSLTEESLLEPSPELPNKIMDYIHSQQNTKKQTKILAMQFAKLGIAVCLMMTIFFSGLLGFTFGPTQRFESVNPSSPPSTQSKPTGEKNYFFSGIADSINKGFFDFANQINLGFKGDAKYGTK